jgi:hypothetical protein
MPPESKPPAWAMEMARTLAGPFALDDIARALAAERAQADEARRDADDYRRDATAEIVRLRREADPLRALRLGDPVIETGESGMRGERGVVVESVSNPGTLAVLWHASDRLPPGLQTGVTHGTRLDVGAMRREAEEARRGLAGVVADLRARADRLPLSDPSTVAHTLVEAAEAGARSMLHVIADHVATGDGGATLTRLLDEARAEVRAALGELRTDPRCKVCGGSGCEPDGSTCDCYGWHPKGSARLRKELEEFARASVENDERIAALTRELRDAKDNAEASAEDARDASTECARLRAMVENAAVGDVLTEREKQRAKWGDGHDDEHADEALAAAASVLLHPNAPSQPCGCREAWCPHLSIVPDPEPIPGPPWALPLRWKQRSRRDQIVVGVALGLAEIERLDRAEGGSDGE